MVLGPIVQPQGVWSRMQINRRAAYYKYINFWILLSIILLTISMLSIVIFWKKISRFPAYDRLIICCMEGHAEGLGFSNLKPLTSCVTVRHAASGVDGEARYGWMVKTLI